MQALPRLALDEILDLHGVPDLKWAVTYPAAGAAALPMLLLPAEQRCLPESHEAVSCRFGAFRVQPRAGATLLFVLGRQAALANRSDLTALARNDAIEPLPLVVACGPAWRPFWQLTLEQGRVGVAAYGRPGVFNCALDSADRQAITDFVRAC